MMCLRRSSLRGFSYATRKDETLVSVRSQQGTRELIAADGTRKPVIQREFSVPADHLNEVGWWDPEEAINPLFAGSIVKQALNYEQRVRDLYLQIAQGLRPTV